MMFIIEVYVTDKTQNASLENLPPEISAKTGISTNIIMGSERVIYINHR